MNRTDRNNNPVAFTIDIAQQAKLQLGVDFEKGDAFIEKGQTFYTARLLGDPIEITLRVIDAIGFYTRAGAQRWNYVAIPKELWDSLSREQKLLVLRFMYTREGGAQIEKFFPHKIELNLSDQIKIGDKLG